jgi:putative DNA primase/helicase
VKKVRAARAELGPFAITVIDTLARTMGGGNESASEDMAEYIAGTRALEEAAGGVVLAIHHAGKNAAAGARGHSSLHAASDGVIEITRAPGGIRTAKVAKLRDGADGEEFNFRLQVVDLGRHPDPAAEPGEAWTSCVVVHTDEKPVGRATRPLPAGATVALDALRKALELRGELLPGTSSIPAGRLGVRAEAWQEAYHALRPLPKDASREDARRDANARRTAFNRAQDTLQAARAVGTWNGWWWIA